jgi:hypothetical protein
VRSASCIKYPLWRVIGTVKLDGLLGIDMMDAWGVRTWGRVKAVEKKMVLTLRSAANTIIYQFSRWLQAHQRSKEEVGFVR